jgi:hypothetical protein
MILDGEFRGSEFRRAQAGRGLGIGVEARVCVPTMAMQIIAAISIATT